MGTYDVAAFQLPANFTMPEDQALWALDGTGHAVTGILKLAQRVLLQLLTVRGSQPFSPNTGTSLLSAVRQGQVRNEIDAYMYFQYAVSELRTNLQADGQPTDPADERFADLAVTSLTFTPLQLSYSLKLTSASGDSRALTLPVSTLP
jgi:hypothetical protein